MNILSNQSNNNNKWLLFSTIQNLRCFLSTLFAKQVKQSSMGRTVYIDVKKITITLYCLTRLVSYYWILPSVQVGTDLSRSTFWDHTQILSHHRGNKMVRRTKKNKHRTREVTEADNGKHRSYWIKDNVVGNAVSSPSTWGCSFVRDVVVWTGPQAERSRVCPQYCRILIQEVRSSGPVQCCIMYHSAIPDFPGSGFATDPLTAKFRFQMALVDISKWWEQFPIKCPIIIIINIIIIIIQTFL